MSSAACHGVRMYMQGGALVAQVSFQPRVIIMLVGRANLLRLLHDASGSVKMQKCGAHRLHAALEHAPSHALVVRKTTCMALNFD